MSQDWDDIIRRHLGNDEARKLEKALSAMPEELLPDDNCDRKEVFVKDTLLFTYTPVNLGRFSKAEGESDRESAAFASLIPATVPEDGRLALPFHLLRPLREEYIAWHDHNSRLENVTSLTSIWEMLPKLKGTKWSNFVVKRANRYTCDLPDDGGVMDLLSDSPIQRDWPQRIVERIESVRSELKFFFGADFRQYGELFIWDVDPRTAAQISYDLGHRNPRIYGGGSSHGAVYCNKLREMSRMKNWMAANGSFSPANQSLDGIAPWQRIIYCEGLCLASSTAKKREFFPFDYFLGMDAASLMTAPKMHLAGILRGGNESANPYLNPDHAFHITFFEKLQARYGNEEKYYRTLIARDDLKIGHLFGTLRSGQENKSWAQRGCQQAFYRSSFTVLTISRRSENRAKASDDWYWTMLILAPPKFIQHLAEILDSIPGDIIATGQASGQTAQLSRVVYALRIIEKRWRELDEYIGDLLMEDFMDPVAYCQLLFDDSTFSRSRLYFWVLGCLNEFDPMIEDNITQWKLYREARVTPCLRSASAASSTSPSSEESSEGGPHQFDKAQDRAWFLELDQKGEQAKRDLEKVREGFEAKKKRVIALRDGLFNASALIESRSSTRLGMNVQLLTYVSIFYLPMGFCAALWAIPNITDQHTQTPFIITAVLTGLVTYLAVFNLENLAQLPGRVYGSHRKRLVQQMEQDEDQAWKGRSGGFEEFPPSAGQRRPSEWWIMRYQMLRLLRRLRTAATPCTAVVVNCFDFIRRLPSSLRRQEDSDEKKSEV